jgi:hypothetical protein
MQRFDISTDAAFRLAVWLSACGSAARRCLAVLMLTLCGTPATAFQVLHDEAADNFAVSLPVSDEVDGVPDITALPCTDLWWFQSNELGYQGAPHVFGCGEKSTAFVWANARGFWSNDLRYEFTGQESTIGVEGATLASVVHQEDGWTSAITAEFYLNQRFDDNLLVDYPLRESFSHNFDIDTFEISQLFITANRNDWFCDLGKLVTPFGRYWAPTITNERTDAPFIRTESVLFRETGIQLRYQPNHWRLAAAITNGSSDQDTNSSKALVARAGFDAGNFAGGASVKTQDGIGSENQKEFKNHAGIDLMMRNGRLILSTEWIYDEYGLRRPGFDLDDITWGRSLYNRQLNRGLNQPLSGWGWYANANWQGARANTILQYGEFHPNRIGDNIHDQITRRISSKYIRRISDRLDWYVSGIFENRVANAQDNRNRKGAFVLTGFQFNF